jgi:hypothetical protein
MVTEILRHFDAAGQQALGKAFASAMQSLVAPN